MKIFFYPKIIGKYFDLGGQKRSNFSYLVGNSSFSYIVRVQDEVSLFGITKCHKINHKNKKVIKNRQWVNCFLGKFYIQTGYLVSLVVSIFELNELVSFV